MRPALYWVVRVGATGYLGSGVEVVDCDHDAKRFASKADATAARARLSKHNRGISSRVVRVVRSRRALARLAAVQLADAYLSLRDARTRQADSYAHAIEVDARAAVYVRARLALEAEQ